MAYNYCRTCCCYHEENACLPEWTCQIVGEDGTDRVVRAIDAAEAAERYAEDYDNDEYTLLKGNVILVEVCRDGKSVRFHVSGESLPHYYAREAAPN